MEARALADSSRSISSPRTETHATTSRLPETSVWEKRPLERVDDSFKRVIITRDALMPHYEDSGILILGLSDFLLEGDALRA